MTLMDSRWQVLGRTLEGWNVTGVPLIAKLGDRLEPSGYTDDIGLYYFVPALSRLLGLSLPATVDLFLGGLVWAGFGLGVWGFFRAFQNSRSRAVAVAGLLLLALFTLRRISDVYVIFAFAVTSFAPLCLAASRRREGNWGPYLILVALAGLVLGYCNFVRSQSGNGMMLFLFLWLLFNGGFPWKAKAWLALVLAVFFLIPHLHFKVLTDQRNQYLSKNTADYKPYGDSHPLWHSVYIGLGFLPNPYGLQYSDTVAAQKVASVDPKIGYCTQEYDAVLRQATLDIFRKDPWFVIRTILLKALLLAGYFLMFANLGILCAFYARPSWREWLPMAVAGLFYALPGVLVMPSRTYVLGMISLSVVFGIYSISLALERLALVKTGRGA